MPRTNVYRREQFMPMQMNDAMGVPGDGSPDAMMRQAQAHELANSYISKVMQGTLYIRPDMKNMISPERNQKHSIKGSETQYGFAKKDGRWITVPWGSVAGTGSGPLYGPGY